MRSGLFVAAAAVLLAAPVVGPAADPPIVFQTQPVGRMLNDIRAIAKMIGQPVFRFGQFGNMPALQLAGQVLRLFGQLSS